MSSSKNSYLRRLPEEFYHGRASVFWTLCIQDRKTGWLGLEIHYRLREIMLHMCMRYYACIPVYCLMPDHLHMVLLGMNRDSNLLKAMSFYRRQSNAELKAVGVEWQKQAHEHVLREDELEKDAFLSTMHYIFQNPVRKGFVVEWKEWNYSGAIIPGYPHVEYGSAQIWKYVNLSRELFEKGR